MLWKYLLVFIGAFVFDVVPIPFPPAFTIMVFLQIKYDLNIWYVLAYGVTGSILGRFVLTLYIPKLSGKIFTKGKNEDVQFLGRRLSQKGWKSQALIFVYSLMPLPTTPLFLAAGIARLKPVYIIPAFTIAKFLSDMVLVLAGDYAAQNTAEVLHGMISWKSVLGLVLGLLLIFALLFIDWRTLLRKKKLELNFHVFSRRRH
jgi:membrane protein DedA with SNARE-associated domain